MNITKKQIKNETYTIGNNKLTIGEQSYFTNDIVFGFIFNTYFEGRIIIREHSLTIYQNQIKTGNVVNNNLGFSDAYSFSLFNGNMPRNLLLYNYKNDKDNEYVKILNEKYPLPNLHINKYGGLVNLKHNITLFKTKEIEKCCGAVLLYDFPRKYRDEDSNYSEFTKEDIDELDDYMAKYLNTNKICYLLESSEMDSIDFLTKNLKFKIVDDFKNKNTANNLSILSRNN
jgi:hypothetical protein